MTPVERVRSECNEALNKLRPLFLPHCQLSLVMRNPQISKTGHLLVSNDDPELLIQAIRDTVEFGKEIRGAE